MAVAAVVAGVAVAWTSGGAVAADSAGEVQSSLVEDFAYPGADVLLAEHGLKVFTGDGHILFDSTRDPMDGPCETGQIGVDVQNAEHEEGLHYCFTTSGARGFVTLEVPNTFLVRAGNATVEATAELSSGEEQTFTAKPNRSVGIEPGEADDWPQAILLELRFGAW